MQLYPQQEWVLYRPSSIRKWGVLTLRSCWTVAVAGAAFILCLSSLAEAQSGAAAGTVAGVVTDPSGAAVPGAAVEILNPVSGYQRSHVTDGQGRFTFSNVPPNPYHLTVSMKGFATFSQDVEVRSSVPVTLTVSLRPGISESVTVEASDLLEREPTAHMDVDRSLFDKLPLQSASSSLSSLVTLSTPGVVADSNGLFHGQGEHADNQFSIDGNMGTRTAS